MDGCFWFDITQWICGVSKPGGVCYNCTALTVGVRSAITNLKGKTCTWSAMGGYAQDFKATMADAGQNSNLTTCTALAAASANDEAELSKAEVRPFFGNAFGDAAAAKCDTTATPSGNSAAAFVPGAAFLVVAALM